MRRFRVTATALAAVPAVIVSLLITHASVGASDWPGWRGDGSGVTNDVGLPIEWGPEQNILWKTYIGGDGISSPIVVDDKVFVTTAIEGMEATVSRAVIEVACSAMLIIAVASALWRLRWRSAAVPAGVLGQFDRVAVAIAGVAFLAGSAAWLAVPDRLIASGDPARAWLAAR